MTGIAVALATPEDVYTFCSLPFAKILSGLNAFGISNLQEQETESR